VADRLPRPIDNNRVTDPFETRRVEPPLYAARSGGCLGPSSQVNDVVVAHRIPSPDDALSVRTMGF